MKSDWGTKPYESHRYFIGGSDARVIMGSDEAALVRLWQEKRGEAEPEDLSGVGKKPQKAEDRDSWELQKKAAATESLAARRVAIAIAHGKEATGTGSCMDNILEKHSNR